MCLAVPMKVIKVDEAQNTAVVDAQGVRREISTRLLTDDLHAGDYVVVHVGYAIEVLDTKSAEEILYILGLGEKKEVKRSGRKRRPG